MQNETQELLQKLVPNEWRSIWASGSDMDESLTATYARALENDCFEHYRPISTPYEPTGFREDFEDYRSLKDENSKTKAWKALREKYLGYFRAKEDAEFNNLSNLSFLKEMLAHFERLSLLSYAGKVRERIMEFRMVA